ncbi:MAG: carboxypeptidase regulatory-like domain-containing protein [Deltaproteobacteria bacterium]|nr:carboxypeptidase regulatory-like domain-containing protein [Deltaproteobacteria bacterium]
MSANRRNTLLLASALLVLVSAGSAAASGTLKYTFKYKNPDTGVEETLLRSWAYVRSASRPPPMEKYLSKPDYVLSGTQADGSCSIVLPEGTYWVRILQRKNRTDSSAYKGPPEEGDYTWIKTVPIMITTNGVVDLGTIYAAPFAYLPITVSGTVRDIYGRPLAGQYVRAQTEPCIEGDEVIYPNQCGPVKDLAMQRTDANGQYTLTLRDPGTYYIYATARLIAGTSAGYNSAGIGAPGPVLLRPVTVRRGDKVTVDVTKWDAL